VLATSRLQQVATLSSTGNCVLPSLSSLPLLLTVHLAVRGYGFGKEIFILSYQIAYQETSHNRLLHRDCIITVKLTGCIQRRLNLPVYGCLLTSLNIMCR
jgi:hypothetical protein